MPTSRAESGLMRFNPLHLRGRRVSTRLDQMTDLVPAAQGSPALQIFPEGGDRQVAQFAPRRVAQGPAQVVIRPDEGRVPSGCVLQQADRAVEVEPGDIQDAAQMVEYLGQQAR